MLQNINKNRFIHNLNKIIIILIIVKSNKKNKNKQVLLPMWIRLIHLHPPPHLRLVLALTPPHRPQLLQQQFLAHPPQVKAKPTPAVVIANIKSANISNNNNKPNNNNNFKYQRNYNLRNIKKIIIIMEISLVIKGIVVKNTCCRRKKTLKRI